MAARGSAPLALCLVVAFAAGPVALGSCVYDWDLPDDAPATTPTSSTTSSGSGGSDAGTAGGPTGGSGNAGASGGTGTGGADQPLDGGGGSEPACTMLPCGEQLECCAPLQFCKTSSTGDTYECVGCLDCEGAADACQCLVEAGCVTCTVTSCGSSVEGLVTVECQ